MFDELAGKKPGSIVHGSWATARRPGKSPEVFWGDSVPAHYMYDPRVETVVTRAYGLRHADGRWHLYPTRAAAKAAWSREALADTRYKWAETAETLVRKAFKAHKPRHVSAKLIDKSVKSSYLSPGRESGWIRPDPFHVYVFTEVGLGDPYHYDDVYALFNKVAEEIKSDPWYDDAGWESVRTGVAYFWVKPKLIA